MTIKYEGEPVKKYLFVVKPQKLSGLGRVFGLNPKNVLFSMFPEEKPRFPKDVVLRSAGSSMARLVEEEINIDPVCEINGIEWVPNPPIEHVQV